MSEQDRYELTASAINDDDLALVPIELAEAACRLLEVELGRRAELVSSFRRVVADYLLDQSLEPFYQNAGGAKQALKRFLRSKCDAPLAAYVAPEYVITIEDLAEQLRCAAIAQCHLSREQPVEAFIRKAARIFLAEYQPLKGRPTNLPLEEVVRNMIDLLVQHTGRLPEVSLNKNNGRPPELRSPEAKAIGVLLRGVDPKLPESAIVNMLEKVKRRPKETEHFLQAVFRANPVADLGASLLAGRETAMQEILTKLL